MSGPPSGLPDQGAPSPPPWWPAPGSAERSRAVVARFRDPRGGDDARAGVAEAATAQPKDQPKTSVDPEPWRTPASVGTPPLDDTVEHTPPPPAPPLRSAPTPPLRAAAAAAAAPEVEARARQTTPGPSPSPDAGASAAPVGVDGARPPSPGTVTRVLEMMGLLTRGEDPAATVMRVAALAEHAARSTHQAARATSPAGPAWAELTPAQRLHRTAGVALGMSPDAPGRMPGSTPGRPGTPVWARPGTPTSRTPVSAGMLGAVSMDDADRYGAVPPHLAESWPTGPAFRDTLGAPAVSRWYRAAEAFLDTQVTLLREHEASGRRGIAQQGAALALPLATTAAEARTTLTQLQQRVQLAAAGGVQWAPLITAFSPNAQLLMYAEHLFPDQRARPAHEYREFFHDVYVLTILEFLVADMTRNLSVEAIMGDTAALFKAGAPYVPPGRLRGFVNAVEDQLESRLGPDGFERLDMLRRRGFMQALVQHMDPSFPPVWETYANTDVREHLTFDFLRALLNARGPTPGMAAPTAAAAPAPTAAKGRATAAVVAAVSTEPARAASLPFQGSCFYCAKVGHRAGACRTRLRDVADGKTTEEASLHVRNPARAPRSRTPPQPAFPAGPARIRVSNPISSLAAPVVVAAVGDSHGPRITTTVGGTVSVVAAADTWCNLPYLVDAPSAAALRSAGVLRAQSGTAYVQTPVVPTAVQACPVHTAVVRYGDVEAEVDVTVLPVSFGIDESVLPTPRGFVGHRLLDAFGLRLGLHA